ncbi:Platinum sensitivity protein, partial [Coemansia asiatica]
MTPADSQVRVKVYQLDSNSMWADKGTGFCTLEDYQGVLHLNVVSETELNRIILDCVVQPGEVYQRQEERANGSSPVAADDEDMLPQPTMASLAEIERIISNSSQSLYLRDKLTSSI